MKIELIEYEELGVTWYKVVIDGVPKHFLNPDEADAYYEDKVNPKPRNETVIKSTEI